MLNNRVTENGNRYRYRGDGADVGFSYLAVAALHVASLFMEGDSFTVDTVRECCEAYAAREALDRVLRPDTSARTEEWT